MSLLPDQPAAGPGVRTKVCGITREEDVQACATAEVDAIGFNIAAGPRKIELERARALATATPPGITRVLLVMDQTQVDLEAAIAGGEFDALQLHGSESPELVSALLPQIPVIKAFRVRDTATLDTVASFPCTIALLDAYVPGVAGGTGATWDHRLLAGRDLGKPVMIAGGLRPDNVADAIAATGAWAVDTASGVESAPGIKDADQIDAFVAAARNQ